MKKVLSVVAAAVLCSFMAAACAEVKNISALGFSLDYPDAPENINYSLLLDKDHGCLGADFLFVNADEMNPYLEKIKEAEENFDEAAVDQAQAEYDAASDANIAKYGTVVGILTSRLEEGKAYCGVDDRYQELGTNGDYTYYVAKFDLGPDSTLSEDSRAKFEASKAVADAVIDSVKLIPIKERVLASAIGDFNTVDMNGNSVDSSIFSQADVTVVNLWATNCNPCIGEMPELAAWAKTLPENVQVLGIICDVTGSSDKTYGRAQKIIEKAGIGFTNLLRCDGMAAFLSTVSGTPTTLFIGRDGQFVHSAVVGAKVSEYDAAVKEVLGK